MKNQIFTKRSQIQAPLEEVFAWHCRPGAIQRLNPPWEHLRMIRKDPGIEDGAQSVFEIKGGPIPIYWHARHFGYEENKIFKDVQEKGPFSFWEHTHIFETHGKNSCFMEDRIKYRLPMSPLSQFLAGSFVENKLNRMFDYRHKILQQDMFHLLNQKNKALKIVISGSSGCIGSALIPFLTTQGHQVIRLVRKDTPLENEAKWDINANYIDAKCFENADAVIHLAGEQIGNERWSDAKKAKVMDSRVKGTKLIAKTIAKMDSPPPVLISASAIGYYGDYGTKTVTEKDSPGDMFISEVCREWEKSARAAVEKGIRVAFMRIGIVLTPAGAALAKMLPAFQAGTGGIIGSGKQYMSWIAIDDIIGAIDHVLQNDIRGPVNLTAPNPVQNKKFIKCLAKTINRPAPIDLPPWFIKTLFGEMGKELLLSGSKVIPEKLLRSGYKFHYQNLEEALSHILGRKQ